MLTEKTKNIKTRHFFLLGNGGSGTSLLRGLLNAHPLISCQFEDFNRKSGDIWAAWDNEKRKCQDRGVIWGDKVPVEQFFNKPWTDEKILQIGEHGYWIVWIIRRFSKYRKLGGKSEKLYPNWFARGQTIYWQFRERWPDKIIQVSFEDLILRTEMELTRICDFLGINFNPAMLSGTNNTGFGKYDQPGIDKSKV